MEKGFTLSELMIASLLLAFTLIGMIGLITNLTALIEVNRNTFIATLHAQQILETIRRIGSPAQVVSRVNAGEWDLSDADLAASPYSLTTLNEEHIDTALFQSGNPCGVTITVSWSEPGRRSRSLNMQTLIGR